MSLWTEICALDAKIEACRLQRKDLLKQYAMELSLEDGWAFFVHMSGVEYSHSYTKLLDVDTVGGFWSMFNVLPSPFELCHGTVRCNDSMVSAYSLFRQGIRPEWEDPKNAVGGEWGSRESVLPQYLPLLWRDLCMACVNEEFEDVLGVRLVYKMTKVGQIYNKIEVWTTLAEEMRMVRVYNQLEVVFKRLGIGMPRFWFVSHRAKTNRR